MKKLQFFLATIAVAFAGQCANASEDSQPLSERLQKLSRLSIQLTSEEAIFLKINQELQNLRTLVRGFEITSDLKSVVGQSSDPSILTAVAATSAILGSINVEVLRLATNESWEAGFKDLNKSSVTSTAGTMTVTVRGISNVLNVPVGTTLLGLANLINAANIGVNATVYDTGNGTETSARISVTSNETGKRNFDPTMGVNFNLSFTSTLTDLTTGAFGAVPVVEGVNSEVKINGSPTSIFRQTNLILDVIPHVTLNLISAHPGKSVSLSFTENTSYAVQKLKTFIEKYNSALTLIKKSIMEGPTTGDISLIYAYSKLTTSVTAIVSALPDDLSVRALTDLGIWSLYSTDGSNAGGPLSFDEVKFSGMLDWNFNDVRTFFDGGVTDTGIHLYRGFAYQFGDILDSLCDPIVGVVTGRVREIALENLMVADQIQDELEKTNPNSSGGQK